MGVGRPIVQKTFAAEACGPPFDLLKYPHEPIGDEHLTAVRYLNDCCSFSSSQTTQFMKLLLNSIITARTIIYNILFLGFIYDTARRMTFSSLYA